MCPYDCKWSDGARWLSPAGRTAFLIRSQVPLYQHDHGAPWFTHRFVHFELRVGFGAEQFIRAGRDKLFNHVGEQEEVIEEEAIQLLTALGLVQFAAVQELPWSQAVCEGVEHRLLGETKPISSSKLMQTSVPAPLHRGDCSSCSKSSCVLVNEFSYKRREGKLFYDLPWYQHCSQLQVDLSLTNNIHTGLTGWRHLSHGHVSVVQKLCLEEAVFKRLQSLQSGHLSGDGTRTDLLGLSGPGSLSSQRRTVTTPHVEGCPERYRSLNPPPPLRIWQWRLLCPFCVKESPRKHTLNEIPGSNTWLSPAAAQAELQRWELFLFV